MILRSHDRLKAGLRAKEKKLRHHSNDDSMISFREYTSENGYFTPLENEACEGKIKPHLW